MNYEPLIAVLPESKENAKSMKEIAQAYIWRSRRIQVGLENNGRLPEF